MKCTHIRYDMIGAYHSGANEHPQKVMKNLGIRYEKAVPNMMGDCWDFLNVSNIPDKLPAYLEELKANPY